ncbi:MAG: tyrosine-type recombinase/integrase [Candidatus Limnocylindrales bacterium]
MTRRGPNEGSIYQRKDGRWEGAVHMGYETNRRVRKFVIGRTRKEAGDKLAVLLKTRDAGRSIPNQRDKVGPFLRRWLDETAKPTLRASTYDSYDDIVRLHLIPGLGRIPLARLSPADVQGLLNAKLASGLSPRRVQYLHAVLRRALVIAERWGLVSRNVAKLVDPPRVPRHEIAPLTPEQARHLIDSAAHDRYRALYVIALGTGLRQGELLGLRWRDVDLEAGRLQVRHTLACVEGGLTLLEPKSDRSRRTVMLPEVVTAGLRAHRTRQPMEQLVAGSRWVDSGHVFTSTIGTPLHGSTVTRAFQAALTRSELPQSRFHDLRHAAATFLLAQGFTLEDVKNLLGHSSIVLTSNTYGHILERRQREVARGMDAVLSG